MYCRRAYGSMPELSGARWHSDKRCGETRKRNLGLYKTSAHDPTRHAVSKNNPARVAGELRMVRDLRSRGHCRVSPSEVCTGRCPIALAVRLSWMRDKSVDKHAKAAAACI